MKIGIIREGKVPPDKRVPFTPLQCRHIMDHMRGLEVFVQPSPIRCFPDVDYTRLGIPLKEDLSDCDVLMGVKEVPRKELIPGKTYFIFSHTIKKQPYNRELLREMIEKNIQLVDYEVLTDSTGMRIKTIADITCDIDGSIPTTRTATAIDNPCYDIDPKSFEIHPPFSACHWVERKGRP